MPVSKIMIRIDGGFAKMISKPRGVEIQLNDYDVDGISELELDKDENGKSCKISHWGPDDVIGRGF